MAYGPITMYYSITEVPTDDPAFDDDVSIVWEAYDWLGPMNWMNMVMINPIYEDYVTFQNYKPIY
jgi:hypothetical protein